MPPKKDDASQKKRGRKPKEKKVKEVEPKRRGRKPKEKVYSVAPQFDPTIKPENEDVILCLPIHSNDVDDDTMEFAETTFLEYNPNMSEPQPYDPNGNDCNFAPVLDEQKESVEEELEQTQEIVEEEQEPKPTIIEEEPFPKQEPVENRVLSITGVEDPNFDINVHNDMILEDNIHSCSVQNIMYEFMDANKNHVWPQQTEIACMWDCHRFTGPPCAIPEKYSRGIFYLSKCFCSYNCAAAYIFNEKDTNMWEKYSLLCFMYSKINNTPYKKIVLAPPQNTLKMFGGYLEIEEFRNSSITNAKIYKIINPPMVSIIPQVEENLLDTNKNRKFIPIDNNLMGKASKAMKAKQETINDSNKKTLGNYLGLKVV